MESSVWVQPEIKEFIDGLSGIQKKFSDSKLNPEIYSGYNKFSWDNENPVISAVKPIIDLSLARNMSGLLLGYLVEFKPDWKRDMELINKLSDEDFSQLLSLYIEKNMTGVEHIIREHQITPAVAEFGLSHTIKPFLQVFAGYFKKHIDLENWLEGYCPVCGEKTVMARIDKNGGRRYLRCGCCDTEWLFKLLRCPWCGNEDHKSLPFLYIEETPGYGLHVCELCKGYIKVIDEQKGGNPRLISVESETIFLDLIARQHGYSL